MTSIHSNAQSWMRKAYGGSNSSSELVFSEIENQLAASHLPNDLAKRVAIFVGFAFATLVGSAAYGWYLHGLGVAPKAHSVLPIPMIAVFASAAFFNIRFIVPTALICLSAMMVGQVLQVGFASFQIMDLLSGHSAWAYVAVAVACVTVVAVDRVEHRLAPEISADNASLFAAGIKVLAFWLVGGVLLVADMIFCATCSMWPSNHAIMDSTLAYTFAEHTRIASLGALVLLIAKSSKLHTKVNLAIAVAVFAVISVFFKPDIIMQPESFGALLGLAVLSLFLLAGYVAPLAFVILTILDFYVRGLEAANSADGAVGEYLLLHAGFSALVVLLLYTQAWKGISSTLTESTVRRLSRVQDFAKVGYFVIDLDTGVVHVDPVGAQIVTSPRKFDVLDFLQRVHPADRAAIKDALENTGSDSKVVSFRVTDAEKWSEGAKHRFVVTYIWYEDVPGRGRTAYGAGIDRTEEAQHQHDLQEALNQISQQQDRLTQLFSIISHELRTPASIISMLLEEAEQKNNWDETGPKLRQVTNQLLTVLGDMRQVVRPEENLPIVMEEFTPREKLERIRNTFTLLAERSGVAITIDGGNQGHELRVSDRNRLGQAISNLVKNAIIHSGGDRVVLGYSEETSDTGVIGVWRVADNGTGIPDAKKSEIFQPFIRGTATTHTRVDGSGLGLYIVKSSLQLLGGSVECLDRAGGGTEFVLRVPLKAVEGVAPKTVALPASQPDYSPLKSMRVLVAEDSELMGELLKKSLEKYFAEVTLIPNGADALARFREDPHDLVITDLFMPGMGGDELTRNLRLDGFQGIIIGMTAAALNEEANEFDSAGTQKVLTKPVSVKPLLSLIVDFLEHMPPPVTVHDTAKDSKTASQSL